MDTKVCTKCKKELPATNECFHVERSCRDGLQGKCKECRKQYYRENKERIKQYRKQWIQENKEHHKQCQKQWIRENKEQRKEYQKQYRQENKERLKQHQKQYRQENKERIVRRNKQYYQENKERIKQYQKQWIRENKEYCVAMNQKRVARLKQLPANLMAREWIYIKDIFNHSCAYCGKHSQKLHQEHFIPLSKNGEYTKHNIIPACKSCNSSKNDKLFQEWYPEQPFYSKERERFIYEHFAKMAQEDGKGNTYSLLMQAEVRV